MIAKNYRRHPEALLLQLELALDAAIETMQALRVKGGAVWANLVHSFTKAAPDVRGTISIPEWAARQQRAAKALAAMVRAACLPIIEAAAVCA